jgi:ADP-ribose pyrophosphatase
VDQVIDYYALMQSHPELFRNESAILKIINDPEAITAWRKDQLETLDVMGLPPEWGDIGVILDDPYFMVLRDLVEFPNGERRGYSRVIGQANLKGGRGAVILPEYQGKLLLLHLYRHAPRAWMYEAPRGYGEPHLPPAENARKEIREEIGGEVSELGDLGTYYDNSGLVGPEVALFYAKLSSVGEPDENEGIQSFELVTVTELEEWIRSEKVCDGFTIAAYTRAKLRGII